MTDTSRPAARRSDTDRRAALRAFVRAHHPDVGGDPALFRDGLAALRSDVDPPSAHGLLATDDPRFDGPIVAVPGGAIHRIGRLGRRLIRRYDPRPGSARVR